MNAKGKIVLGMLVAILLIVTAGYFGAQYLNQLEEDKYGRILERGIESYSRGKLDVVDVRRVKNVLEIYTIANEQRPLTFQEIGAIDRFFTMELKNTDATIVAYLWTRESGGEYYIVNMVVCEIPSILEGRPNCQSAQRFTPVAKKHLRWMREQARPGYGLPPTP